MPDVTEKATVAPTFEGRSPSLIPQVKPPISVTALTELITLEPGEDTQAEALVLIPRQTPLPLPCFSISWADEFDNPHWNKQASPCTYPGEPNWTSTPWSPYG